MSNGKATAALFAIKYPFSFGGEVHKSFLMFVLF